MKAKILAVDDEPEILALVEAALENDGFDVFTALSVSDFRKLNAEHTFDIYLIDVGLPDGSGFSLVKELRKGSDAGILMLTGRSSETDQVVGLEIGADDYVTKPFRLRELAARVNAVYRRSAAQTDSNTPHPDRSEPPEFASVDFTFDGYKLSMSGRRLWGPVGAEIVLTTAEFDLLAALLKRRGQVLDRDQLMNAMKGRDWESYDRAIDGLVSRLRRKIPAINRATHYVRTVHGVGYSFNG